MQGQSLDLLNVVGHAEGAREDLVFVRNDSAKQYFSRWFEYVVEMASLIDIVPNMSRVTAHQQYRKKMQSLTHPSTVIKRMCPCHFLIT